MQKALNIFLKFSKNIKRYFFKHRKLYIILTLFALAFIKFQSSFSREEDNRNLKFIAEKWFDNDGWFEQRTSAPEFLAAFDDLYISDIFLNNVLANLPYFQEKVQCPILFDIKHPNYTDAKRKASAWKYDVSESQFWKQLENSSNICSTIQKTFSFFTKPLSHEESDFPLAYGMLAYKDIRQITFMLSAFYQPQNAYCIAIDGKATEEYKRRMKVFQICFPNIHVFPVNGEVTWCGPEIPEIVLSCVQKLNELNHPWKYYQYLSGVDLPLKTNLEMVRIFKALNGTFNAQVHNLFPERYADKGTPPLPIWVSSLSASFSRASANVISNNPKIYELLQFLQKTVCADESLWATIAGNPEYIEMPGGFSASEFHKRIQSELPNKANMTKLPATLTTNSFQLQSFYISRHQVWNVPENNFSGKCGGFFKNASCVFGVFDLPELLVRPELVAHKFYIDKHPAAFFCLYQKIRQRSLNFENQQNFDASNYAQLPQVLLSKGKSLNDVKFFF